MILCGAYSGKEMMSLDPQTDNKELLQQFSNDLENIK